MVRGHQRDARYAAYVVPPISITKMIYDPSRRAQELRRRIIESMSAEEIEEYNRQTKQPEEPGDHSTPGSNGRTAIP